MITQVRGTSGSGKSTVVRDVMKLVGEPWYPVISISNRKNPLYYRQPKASTLLLGHYESPCGGCDTIGSARQVYDLIYSLPKESKHVLSEGLLLSEDTKWTTQMGDLGFGKVKVVFLTTPIEECIERIKKRRKDAGNEKPLNESNTRKRVEVIERARVKLVASGVSCVRCSSETAPSIILRWLGLQERLKCKKSGESIRKTKDT